MQHIWILFWDIKSWIRNLNGTTFQNGITFQNEITRLRICLILKHCENLKFHMNFIWVGVPKQGRASHRWDYELLMVGQSGRTVKVGVRYHKLQISKVNGLKKEYERSLMWSNPHFGNWIFWYPKFPKFRVPKYLGFYRTSAESDNGT